MKRLMLLAVVAAMLSLNSGCYLLDHIFGCHNGCGPVHGSACGDSCGSDCCGGGCGGYGGCGLGGHGLAGNTSGPDDSIGGVVTYPYYTTRGPRDYLAKTPRSIGP